MWDVPLRLWRLWNRKKKHRMVVRQIVQGVYDNWEAYHVMFQINRFRPFPDTEWARWPEVWWAVPELNRYRERMGSYQEAVQRFLEFEAWYKSDPSRKTRENALRLHELRHEAAERFQGLEPIIRAAHRTLRRLAAVDGVHFITPIPSPSQQKRRLHGGT